MNYETQQKCLRGILTKLYDSGTIDYRDFPELTKKDYDSLLIICDEDNYIKNLSISKYKGGAVIFDDKARITELGVKFMQDKQENPHSLTQNFTFNAPVHSSAIGNDAKITNNFNSSLEELEKIISTLNAEDQIIANEILETVKTQDVKPGMFSRFTDFFEKHPNFVNTLGKSAVWLLTNADKLPLF